jgi:anti-anti-sigma factor
VVTDASMTVGHDSADTARIALFGEIDMANADDVEQQILGAIDNQLTAVTIDLSGLEYIDSAGLRVLFTLGSRLEILQIALRLVVPTGSSIRRVIDLSGMAAAIPVPSH